MSEIYQAQRDRSLRKKGKNYWQAFDGDSPRALKVELPVLVGLIGQKAKATIDDLRGKCNYVCKAYP